MKTINYNISWYMIFVFWSGAYKYYLSSFLRICNMELTMGEIWIRVIDACNFQRLSLRLVNGHREIQFDGKLKVFKIGWITCYHRNSWNIDNITFGIKKKNQLYSNIK